jgi:hypothetical protein
VLVQQTSGLAQRITAVHSDGAFQRLIACAGVFVIKLTSLLRTFLEPVALIADPETRGWIGGRSGATGVYR